MKTSPLAGKPVAPGMLINVPKLITAYYSDVPDAAVAAERVAFGTSGHRGTALERSFNEAHILAITQAVCFYRQSQGTDGPLFLGLDTHALSFPAYATALEVLAANRVEVMLAEGDEYTPTPVISHAILTYNRGRTTGLADGIVVRHALGQSVDDGCLQLGGAVTVEQIGQGRGDGADVVAALGGAHQQIAASRRCLR